MGDALHHLGEHGGDIGEIWGRYRGDIEGVVLLCLPMHALHHLVVRVRVRVGVRVHPNPNPNHHLVVSAATKLLLDRVALLDEANQGWG